MAGILEFPGKWTINGLDFVSRFSIHSLNASSFELLLMILMMNSSSESRPDSLTKAMDLEGCPMRSKSC